MNFEILLQLDHLKLISHSKQEKQSKLFQENKKKFQRRKKFKSVSMEIDTVGNLRSSLLHCSINSENQKPCSEHDKSEVINFSKFERSIQKSRCLEHSNKNFVAFSGIDLKTGQLVYITEWSISKSQLQPHKCKDVCIQNKINKCNGHNIMETIRYIEKTVEEIKLLEHKNLIGYECVKCIETENKLIIVLVQDFVFGTNIQNLSKTFDMNSKGMKKIATDVLDTLIYLHNRGFMHSSLDESNVFVDNTGSVRIKNFTIVSYILKLMNQYESYENDFHALGSMIETLSPTLTTEMSDFIEKCKSLKSVVDISLDKHIFLHSEEPENIQLNSEPPSPDIIPDATTGSRINTDFILIESIGEGAYGFVLKMKNKLDNQVYAVKKIPLPSSETNELDKMMREVKILSRLKHENIVRYYNSWIETATGQSDRSASNTIDWSTSYDSFRMPSSSDYCNNENNWKESSDDGDSEINDDEFINPYEVSEMLTDEDDDSTNIINGSKILRQFMYIQMELCEKSTLKTAIEKNLYLDFTKIWRYLREIGEGLSYIHKQSMIHRDLKPANIFVDSEDRVKIGDFGLAISNVAINQTHFLENDNNTEMNASGTPTSYVGTALYSAPELSGKISKSYTAKVDMYSLGVILFEMSFPPPNTGMERIKILTALRTKEIEIPADFLKLDQNIKIIKWLLDHDPSKRPTALELLSSELIPPPPEDEFQFQELIKKTVAKPQTKEYQYIVSKLLEQTNDEDFDLSYYNDFGNTSSMMEFVKSRVVTLFRKHGAIEIATPLLTPCSKQPADTANTVRLMTQSGNIVYLPYDIRDAFARYIVLNGINSIRCYSIGPVYRERRIFNLHPKQLYQCSFDIITPTMKNLLVDAEVILIAYNMIKKFDISKKTTFFLKINHTSLLKAVIQYCNVPKTTHYNNFYKVLYNSVIRDNDPYELLFWKIESGGIMPSENIYLFFEFLQIDFNLKNLKTNTLLQKLVDCDGNIATLTKNAIEELETVYNLAKSFGVECPIHLSIKVLDGDEEERNGTIKWQFINNERFSTQTVIAQGGRYDTILSNIRNSLTRSGCIIPECKIGGVGFTLTLDTIIQMARLTQKIKYSTIDVVVWVVGTTFSITDVTNVLLSLWDSGVRTGIIEATNIIEAQVAARKLGVSHVIVFIDGHVYIRSPGLRKGKLNQRRQELLDQLDTILKDYKPKREFKTPKVKVRRSRTR